MHFPSLLSAKGCSPERLREIFTATDAAKPVAGGPDASSSQEEALTTQGVKMIPATNGPEAPLPREDGESTKKQKSDWEIRRYFENRIRSRVLSGITTGLANSKPLQAVDLAWDAQPIQKETIPLMLWAQGKIKHEGICDYLTANCDPATTAKFIKKGADGKPILSIPRICDFSVNLVRSYTTRRHAALAALWDNLWPLLKYNPRGTDETAMLSGDVVTQRVDIMAEEYNYRHFLSQCDRDKLLYTHSLIFPRSAWDRQTSWRNEKSNVAGSEKLSTGVESYVTQEGVDCVNPHPSRWFWDLGAPLANINTNNGPSYIGYWDIVPYGSVRNGDYFNTKSIVASEAWTQLVQQNAPYFSQYFNPCVLQFPAMGFCTDPALKNDRTGNIGQYTAEQDDKGVLLTQYFERINPKVEGIGDYDANVWLRIVAAGDGTVVAAEFMPSIPACYGAINANDGRVANASLAMEMLAYQDMASNITTTMIEQTRRSFAQIMFFNSDLIDDKIIKDIQAQAGNKEWWMDPKYVTMSFSEKQELLAQGRFDPNMICFNISMKLDGVIQGAMQALGQLLALADKIVNSSPNEQGQPNPREVAAREVQELSTSVQSIYAFYNEGPREQRTAFKRMVYESLRCHGTDEFLVPVLRRYKVGTIKKAGFEVVGQEAANDDTLLPSMTRIKGSLSDLDYDYRFDSRDGAERAVNTQGAQVLQQLFAGLIQVPGVAQKMGFRRVTEILNIIARMAGAPDEFQLTLNDGEDEDMPGDPAQEAANMPMQPATEQAIQKIMAAMSELAQKEAGLEGLVTAIARKLGFVAGPQVPPDTAPPAVVSNGAPAAPQGAAPVNGAALLANPA